MTVRASTEVSPFLRRGAAVAKKRATVRTSRTKPSPSRASIDVLTHRYSEARCGANQNEAVLKPENVHVETFGKLFTRAVDGDLYAQPLIVSDLTVHGRHHGSVVFLATSHNTVYAYDAEDPEDSLPLWQTNLGQVLREPGLPVPRDEIFKGYLNFGSEIGITSTPVIDRPEGGNDGTLYVVAKTMRPTPKDERGSDDDDRFAYHLHALDILTGKNKKPSGSARALGPVKIEASAISELTGKSVTFTARWHLNRPGLLLHNGVVYLAFGSHGDEGEFWGWIMAYDAHTLKQKAIHCTAIDWGEGGIWQSGNGLAAERVELDDGKAHDYIYAVVGNGQRPVPEAQDGKLPVANSDIPFQAITNPFYGNSILKLELVPRETAKIVGRPPLQGDPTTPFRFDIVDWFTTSDCLDLNQIDQDLVSGPALFKLAGNKTMALPMVLGGGKDGRFYLADRTNLGHWNPMVGGVPYALAEEETKDPITGLVTPKIDPATGKPVPKWQPSQGGRRQNRILQDDVMCAFHIHGTPVIWEKPGGGITAFVWSENDFLTAYEFDPGSKKFKTIPQSTSQYGFPPHELRMPGGILSLSSDPVDPDSAIVWALHPTDDDAMNKTVKGTLRAFRAGDLNDELWNSDLEAAGDDRVGSYAKFCPPVVANGRVYVATFSRGLAVYGLLRSIGKQRQNFTEAFELRGIGPGVQGSATYSCARYNLSASGQGLSEGSDSFYFAFRTIDANVGPGRGVSVAITARILGMQSPANRPDARAGLMIREFGGKNIGQEVMTYAAIVVTGQNRVIFQRRLEVSGKSNQDGDFPILVPCWLRLTGTSVRKGVLSFVGSVSQDGQTWEVISAETEIPMAGEIRIGLAATAQTGQTVGPSTDHIQVSFSDVEVSS
jgi:hypothetical protein